MKRASAKPRRAAQKSPARQHAVMAAGTVQPVIFWRTLPAGTGRHARRANIHPAMAMRGKG